MSSYIGTISQGLLVIARPAIRRINGKVRGRGPNGYVNDIFAEGSSIWRYIVIRAAVDYNIIEASSYSTAAVAALEGEGEDGKPVGQRNRGRQTGT